MRMLLLLGILTFAFSSLSAQQIVIKDSVVTSPNDTTYTAASPFYYTYDADCRLIKRTNQTSQGYLYDYYPDGSVYHYVYQIGGNTYPLHDYAKTTYTYTSSKAVASELVEYLDPVVGRTDLITNIYNSQGQITQSIIQTYDTGTSSFINTYKSVHTYDANGYQVKKDDYYTANPPSPTWSFEAEEIFYRNNQGVLDSSAYLNSKSYYTYGSSGKSATTLTYVYNGEYSYIEKKYTNSDSANYIKKDTSVTSTATFDNPGVFRTTNFSYRTHIYNTDGTQKELDEHILISSYVIYEVYRKTYSTYGSCQSVLPVTLLNFTGRMQNSNAESKWNVENEHNLDRYEVYKSLDGSTFNKSGEVKAVNKKQYGYEDNSSSTAQIVYYRLKIIDKDGSFSYSKTIELVNGKEGIEITGFYPSPLKGNTGYLNITSGVEGRLQIVVTDIAGQRVSTQAVNIIAGSNNIPLTFGKLAAGTYLLRVMDEKSGLNTIRFVKN